MSICIRCQRSSGSTAPVRSAGCTYYASISALTISDRRHPLILPTRPTLRLTPAERHSVVLPAAYIFLLIEGISLLQIILSQDSTAGRLNALWIGGIAILYTWLLFRFVYSRSNPHPLLYWVSALTNGAAVALLASAPLPFAPVTATILIILLILVTAFIAGRWPAYAFILTAFVLGIGLGYPNPFGDLIGSTSMFSLLLVALLITEMILRLGETITAKVTRLETIKQVSRKIASTIEVDQVISLVCAAVQEALLADTYVFSLNYFTTMGSSSLQRKSL